MRADFSFHPTKVVQNARLLEAMQNCMEWAAELALTSGDEVFVTMQHSYKTDEFALLVECRGKSFSAHMPNPAPVFRHVSNQLFNQIERLNAENEKKERASRAKGSKGHRRQSSAGVRSS